MGHQIDLNCDLGEWKTNEGPARDEAIMPYISSCNIACGGHIGDEESMRKTIRLAERYGVKAGAHPSYPDKENFGRVIPDITPEELELSLRTQISTLQQILSEEGQKLHHIKPHGALYNHAAKDEATARLVLTVINEVAPGIPVYLPPASVSGRVASELGMKVVQEVFADRAYEEDLSLRSRTLEGSVLEKEEEVLTQLRDMIFESKVKTYGGSYKTVTAETVCLHSDTPGAVKMAASIHDFLKSQDVRIISA